MPDPYRRMRREALVALLIWLLAGLWTLGVSYNFTDGYTSWAGIPAWAVVGALLPWAVFFLVHVWYSLVFLGDEDEE